MLIDFLRKLCALKISCKFYGDQAIVTIYGLFDRTAEAMRGPLKNYLIQSETVAVITWYTQKYTFIIPKDIAIELELSHLGAPLGYLTYDKICVVDEFFKSASIKTYNILDSIPIKSTLRSLYISTKNPVAIVNVFGDKARKFKKDLEKNVGVTMEIFEDYSVIRINLNADNAPSTEILSPQFILDREIEEKLGFILGYMTKNNLYSGRLKIAYGEIASFCKANNASLSNTEIKQQVLKVLDNLYESCKKESDIKESLEMLELKAELEGIDNFINIKEPDL